MFNSKALLVIGLTLALWGRSLTSDDSISIGLKQAGQVSVRCTEGAVSLSTSEGLLELGHKFALKTQFGAKSDQSVKHKGFAASFQKPMQWEVRMPIFAAVFLCGFLLYVKTRML